MKKAKRTVSSTLAMLLVLGSLTGMTPRASAANHKLLPDSGGISGGSSPDSLASSIIQREDARDDARPEREKPPAPVAASADREPKPTKISTFAYTDTTLTVASFTTGELETALLAENGGEDDFSYVNELIISGGTLNKADCTFIKENLDFVRTLNFSGAAFENNRIPNEAFGIDSEGAPVGLYYMGSLTDVILPASVTAIGNYAFAQTGIETIDISNVTQLGDGVFFGCFYFSDFGAFHNDITHLPDNFFHWCGYYNGWAPLTVDLNNIVSIGDSAFTFSSIETVDISNVTAFGSHVFASCSNLYDFGTFHNSITHLPDGFFYGCSALTGAIDLNNIVSIGHSSLAYSGYDTIDLSNVTQIDENAFAQCYNLTDIVALNDAITEIPPFAFQSTGLTAIDLNKVTSIGEYAFNFGDLQTIDLSSVTSLGESAFACCWDLMSVGTLNPLLTEIPEKAFYQCSSLLSIDLSNVTTLGEYAFYICQDLSDVTLNPGLTEIPEGAFAFCESFTAIDLSNVTRLGDSAFRGCVDLANVTFNSQMTDIPSEAFRGCESLDNIDLSTITSLGQSAFMDCKSLTDIGVLNPALTRIPNEAFKMSGLTSFDFTNIEWIGDSAFSAGVGLPSDWDYERVTGLTGAIDLSNVTWIGKTAFEFCDNLTSVSAFDAPTQIHEGAFQACIALETVDLGNVTYLGGYAFTGCGELLSVGSLHSDVDEIEQYTFYNCQKLQAIDLTHVTSVGRTAFWNCKALSDTGAEHPKLDFVGYAAFECCEGLTGFDLGSATEVGDYAFNQCVNLTNVGATVKLTKIGATAFQETAITAIDLRNVTEFGVAEGGGGGWWASWAFWGCANLKDIGGLNDQLSVIPTSTFNGTALETPLDLTNITDIGDWAFYNSQLYDVIWPASAAYGYSCFADCALDFSPYTRSASPEPFPVGIDNTTNLADIAPNQTPKVFFTLSEQSPLFLTVNEPFPVTHSLLTVNGADIATDIIGNADHSSWLNPAFTYSDIAVTRVPPVGQIDTSVIGGQDITYTIPAATYANMNQIDLRLEVVDPVTGITVRGAGNATAITTKGGTLQMYADILPVTATVQDVIWSVIPGTGNADISPTGLLTATANGTVTVKAAAVDTYNGLSDEMVITISGQSPSGGGGTTACTIRFETNGGSKVASQSVSSGAAIKKPADPVKPDFVFAGWHTDAALTQAFDFNTKITKNMTLYAKWTESKPGEWQNPFPDVRESDWFYPGIKYASQHGLFSGTSATTFSPNATMTRGMTVTVLWRMAGSPDAVNAGFGDVPADSYYTAAVNWVTENGIVKGVGNHRFAPEENITREQMAVMLFGYAKTMDISLPGTRTGNFADSASISGWAAEAVNAMYAAELLSGRDSGNFDPQGNATRAEVATMFMKFGELALFQK